MDNNAMNDQEIDLKDLMFAVFHKWRAVIAVGIVCALLLGGVKAGLTFKNLNDPETIEAAEKKYRDEVDAYEKDKATYEREIENLKTDIANQEEYLEKSIWINMSPYDIYEAKVDLYISTGYEIMPGMSYQNIDYTDTILQAYQGFLTGSAVMEKIADSMGTESRYIKELVTVSTGTVSGRLNHLLTISVKHTSSENAKVVLDQLLEDVNQMQARVKVGIGDHVINTVNRSECSMVDLSLADKQRSENERLTELNNSLKEKQTELEDLEEPEKEANSKTAALKSGIKFAVVGGVVGAFGVAFIVCVMFLLSDKVYSAKELKYRCKARILGRLSSGKKVGKIDLWLNTLEGRCVNPNADVEYQLIAANIRNYIGDMKCLLVTGSAEAASVKTVAEKLREELKEVRILEGANMLETAETVKALADCEGVIFVEQCDDSKYNAVEGEAEKARDLNKAILGYVVYE